METLRIDPIPASVIGGGRLLRPEGVAFSPDGGLLAVADAEAGEVHLHVREGGPGAYAAAPRAVLEGRASRLAYPHDVDFSPDGRLLAVANREGPSITFYARDEAGPRTYGPRPVATIDGKRSKLIYTDGVAFVPPSGRRVAAVNRTSSTVRFFRRAWRLVPGVRFRRRPAATLRGPASHVLHPDGLAFSRDGSLLAVTSHSSHAVTIHARVGAGPRYSLAPVAELRGEESRLRFPHSLAFSPGGGHLAVSSAGGRCVAFFRRTSATGDGAPRWSPTPAFELLGCDPARFEVVNRHNSLDGGPKGVAFGGACFAVCNADVGVAVYRVTASVGQPS